MNYNNKRIAGLLFFVGVVQFVLAVVISEAIYSGYSVGQQYMSDLGDWSLAGNSAAIWDASAILLGVFIIAGAYFIQRGFKNRLFTSLLVISGVGTVAIGVVAENISFPMHSVFALIAMVFGLASVILSYKFEKSPLSYVSVILGAVTLLATALSLSGHTSSGFYLGLGLGGMERFIAYSLLLWMLGFGAYLIGESSDSV
jgi:hypothetical membrane protein